LASDGVSGRVDEGVNEGVNDGVKESIDILINIQGLNATEIAIRIKKSIPTVERYLRILRQKDIVEFRGAPKTGGYYFTEKVNNILNEQNFLCQTSKHKRSGG